MLKKLIPFEQVHQLAKTDLAYATGVEHLVPFYKYDLRHDVFHQIIADKRKQEIPRASLVGVLRDQYSTIPDNEHILSLIDQLADENTFTVTTAHQPSLFLGPLYFVYKAITAINLAEAMQGVIGPAAKILPVFVLGGEDHDIEEVNHIQLFNKHVTWTPDEKGPVGTFSTDSMGDVLSQIDAILGPTEYARTVFEKLKRAYTEQKTFGKGTQALLHELMGRFGLIVLDMNDARLKRHFIPVMEVELKEQVSYRKVVEVAEQLNSLGYKTQATPREINLFYFTGNGRERIIKEGDTYNVLHTDIHFTQEEIITHLHAHPERFSPNVVLRPLYQETILPNLAYVGGGGELAYWLERKSLFDYFGINYPMLVRRNSVLWIDRDSSKKLDRFGFTAAQFFEDIDTLVRQFVENNASGEVSLTTELTKIERVIDRVAEKAFLIDATLENAIRADGVKLKGMVEQWQNRLIRAEKQKHEVTIGQLRTLKEKLFPGGGLQERTENFLPFYLRYSDRFFDILKEKMLPLEHGFIVLEDVS
jgi:bacillithiol biosynthesis cysteine-adding enzyme BshC